MTIHVLYRSPFALAILLLIFGAAGSGQSKPADRSPTRVALDRLLAAINSGDRATLEAYAPANVVPEMNNKSEIDRALQAHKEHGGFDLLEVEEPEPDFLHGWVRAHDSDALLELALAVEPQPPHRVKMFHIGWGQPPQKYFPKRLTESAAIEALRAEATRRAAAEKFSGTIVIMRGDKVLLREAYGLADREKKIANTLDTRFRTASVGKMFTAAAVLRLVQDGKLKLDDTIGKVVPELAGKPIAPATIQQLLAHTSGAGDIFGPVYDAHKNEMRTHDDYVKLYADEVPAFKPGEKFQYSNLGYIWLGAAIERASGKSYYDYLDEAVFRRAGMTHSDFPPMNPPMEGRALGYARPPGTRAWISAREHLEYRGDGAGGAFTTADDLARFLAALHGNRLLDTKYTRLMLAPKREMWKDRSYGYGVFIESYPLTALSIGHNGGEPGTSTEAWFMPDSGYSVVVLSNFEPPEAGQVAGFIRARLPLR